MVACVNEVSAKRKRARRILRLLASVAFSLVTYYLPMREAIIFSWPVVLWVFPLMRTVP